MGRPTSFGWVLRLGGAVRDAGGFVSPRTLTVPEWRCTGARPACARGCAAHGAPGGGNRGCGALAKKKRLELRVFAKLFRLMEGEGTGGCGLGRRVCCVCDTRVVLCVQGFMHAPRFGRSKGRRPPTRMRKALRTQGGWRGRGGV